MAEKFPHIDFVRLKTGTLNLSESTKRELGRHSYASYVLNRSASVLSLLALQLNRPLSDSVRSELIESLQELETPSSMVNSPRHLS